MNKWSLYRVLFSLVLCSFFSFYSVESYAVGWWKLSYCAARPNEVHATREAAASSWCNTPIACISSANMHPGATPVNVGGDASYTTTSCTGTMLSGGTGTVGSFLIAQWRTGTACPAPLVLEGGICVDPPPPDPCEEFEGDVSNSSFGFYYFATSGSDFGGSPTGCFNNCQHSVLNGFQGPMPFGAGYMLVASSIRNKGVSCGAGDLTVTIIAAADIPSVPPETDPNTDGEPDGPGDCPAGTGFAQVNNSSMCLPSGTTGSGPSTSSTSTTSTTTTDPVTGETTTTQNTTSGGTGTVTTSSGSTWTINGDGTVTVETTKTVDYGDGQTSTSTTTSSGGIAGVTSGTTSGSGGSSGGSGSGTGDGNSDTDLGPPPSWSDPGNGGPAPDLTIGGLGDINVHQVFLPEGGACALNDIPLEVMGLVISIPLSQACPYFPYVYGLVVFMSALTSIRLFALAPW